MTLTKWWPRVVLALAGFLLLMAAEGALQREGRLRERIATLEEQAERLRQTERGLDTVYVHRTDTLRFTRHATDSVLAVDTIIHTDTVRQIVERERLACDAVLSTCAKQRATLQALLTNMTKQRDAEKARRGGWIRRTFGCAAGLAGTGKGLGLGGACGLRF